MESELATSFYLLDTIDTSNAHGFEKSTEYESNLYETINEWILMLTVGDRVPVNNVTIMMSIVAITVVTFLNLNYCVKRCSREKALIRKVSYDFLQNQS